VLASCHFLHAAGRFPESATGNLNTHTLFFDLFRQVLADRGGAGIIVPSGLATNEGTSDLFGSVIRTGLLRRFLDCENRKVFFPAVHSSARFALVTLGYGTSKHDAPEFGFFLEDITDLDDSERVFPLDIADLEAVNPNTLTCPTFRTRHSAELVKAIHRRCQIIIPEHVPGEWKASSSRMFDMSYESGDFSRQRAEGHVPLYEGKMVAQFNHRAASVVINPNNAARQAQSLPSTPQQLRDPYFVPNTQYWVPTALIDGKISDKWLKQWLLSFCGVTSSTNERTCIIVATPCVGAGNSLLQIYGEFTAQEGTCLLANLNTLALDYVLREKMGGINLNHFIFRQLPVVSRKTYDEPCPWAGPQSTLKPSTPLKVWLLPRVLELTYTAWDLEPFAQDCGWPGPPFRWNEDRRFVLRCELDAAFFHLYLPAETNGDWRRVEGETEENLARLKAGFPSPRDGVAYIMDSFPIVRRKDEEKHNGDYRTKRVILELYDAIAESIRTGEPYRTLLEPPPADPRCCHPSRGDRTPNLESVEAGK